MAKLFSSTLFTITLLLRHKYLETLRARHSTCDIAHGIQLQRAHISQVMCTLSSFGCKMLQWFSMVYLVWDKTEPYLCWLPGAGSKKHILSKHWWLYPSRALHQDTLSFGSLNTVFYDHIKRKSRYQMKNCFSADFQNVSPNCSLQFAVVLF